MDVTGIVGAFHARGRRCGSGNRIERALEQAIGVGRVLRHGLPHIPMLDDLAISVEAKDVDPGMVFTAWPVLEAVEDYAMPFRNGVLHFDPFARRAIRSKYAMNPSLPAATGGLCWT